jgi:RIO-like serine/threonine protein kinase
LSIWESYSAPTREAIKCRDYADKLSGEINSLLRELSEIEKCVDVERVLSLSNNLLDELQASEETVTLSLSHGDLQSGNIWVENGTDKIYIIDWESYGRRSEHYDRATLYDGIRRVDRLTAYAKVKDSIHATVLLEDVIFRLKELIDLPENFGAEDFEGYVKILEERYV